MPKIRLSSQLRHTLRNLARDLIACPMEDKALVKAYEKAMPLVYKVVAAKYSPPDMIILKKYECAQPDKCIRVQMASGGVEQFTFNDNDAPLAVSTSCRTRMYITDERTTTAVQNWAEARDKKELAFKAKLKDYTALIEGSRTLEEVEAIWPEASQVRQNLNNNLPATITPDILARIAADVVLREQSAVS